MLDPVGCAAPTVFGVGDSARLFGFVVSWTAMLRGDLHGLHLRYRFCGGRLGLHRPQTRILNSKPNPKP